MRKITQDWHRYVGADGKRQDEGGDCGKTRIAAEHAQGVADILE
jgi:hypothetical protein